MHRYKIATLLVGVTCLIPAPASAASVTGDNGQFAWSNGGTSFGGIPTGPSCSNPVDQSVAPVAICPRPGKVGLAGCW